LPAAAESISSGRNLLLNPMKIMGLDVGDRRIGIATSDPLEIVASPREVVRRDGRELDAIERLVREEEIERVVVGMPYNAEGEIGPQAQKVLAFVRQLRQRLAVPVDEWDEHLSTWEAESVLIEAGRRRAERRRVVDKLAAAVILRSYLDHRREQGSA
jgi:putative holliday junction resolvase